MFPAKGGNHAKKTKFQIRSDASKQRWVRDDKKEAIWREHIAKWKASGLSKRGYAIAHNLPESSFNAQFTCAVTGSGATIALGSSNAVANLLLW